MFGGCAIQCSDDQSLRRIKMLSFVVCGAFLMSACGDSGNGEPSSLESIIAPQGASSAVRVASQTPSANSTEESSSGPESDAASQIAEVASASSPSIDEPQQFLTTPSSPTDTNQSLATDGQDLNSSQQNPQSTPQGSVSGGENYAATNDGTADLGQNTADAGQICINSWLTPRFVGDSAPVLTNVGQMNYLSGVLDPRTLPPHAPQDATPTELIRVSDRATFGANRTNFGSDYARRTWMNSDSSLGLIRMTNGSGPWYALVDKDFRFLKYVSASSSGRWHRTKPTRIVYFTSDAQIREYDVETDETHHVHSFKDHGYDSLFTTIGQGEGNPDFAGRIYPVIVRSSSGQWRLSTWDSQTGNLRGQRPIRNENNSADLSDFSGHFNWHGISPSGNFLVAQTHRPWHNGSTRIPVGLNVFDLDGNYLRTYGNSMADGALRHSDLGIDSEGNDVYVTVSAVDNDSVFSYRLDGGGRTLQWSGPVRGTFHVSAQAYKRPGWVVMSTYGTTHDASYTNRDPMWNHVFAIPLDGSNKIVPLGNIRHPNQDDPDKTYRHSAFASPSPDLSSVLFASSMNYDYLPSGIDAYVMRPYCD